MKKNKAVHKGNGLLPYPVIVSASQGDILAMNVVLSHYRATHYPLSCVLSGIYTSFKVYISLYLYGL